jgi:hypothetical protein
MHFSMCIVCRYQIVANEIDVLYCTVLYCTSYDTSSLRIFKMAGGRKKSVLGTRRKGSIKENAAMRSSGTGTERGACPRLNTSGTELHFYSPNYFMK